MSVWRWSAGLVCALVLMAGCTGGRMLQQLEDTDTARAARAWIDRFLSRDPQIIREALIPEMKAAMGDEQLGQLFSLLPEGPVTDSAIASFVANNHNGEVSTEIKIQALFGPEARLFSFRFREDAGALQLVWFNVGILNGDLRELNAFSLAGRTAVHYLIFLSALGLAAFTLGTAVFAWRSIEGRRWLWVLLCLTGVGRVTLNWTTGALDFSSASLLFMAAGFSQAGPFAPILLSVAFPIGAAVFWISRPDRRRGSGAAVIDVEGQDIDLDTGGSQRTGGGSRL